MDNKNTNKIKEMFKEEQETSFDNFIERKFNERHREEFTLLIVLSFVLSYHSDLPV